MTTEAHNFAGKGVTPEQFEDPYLRKLTYAWHKVQCKSNHVDHCSFLFDGWDGLYERRWGPAKRWMAALLKQMERAEAANMDIEQFILYEGLDNAGA